MFPPRIPHAIAAGVTTLLFALACGGGSETTSPPDPVATDPATIAAPAAGGDYTSPDGLITVAHPGPDAWTCRDDHATASGATVTLVKCISTAPDAFLFTMAKDYTVSPSSVLPAKDLVDTEYKAHYAGLYQSVTYTAEGPASIGDHEGWEITFDAVHGAVGEIHKVERVVVAGTHVILLSAEGHPGDFEANREDIERWMAETRFATLQRGE